MTLLLREGVLWKSGRAHVTEFQKRGLPHEHFLLVVDSSSKLNGPDDFDKYISAEIPDEKNTLCSMNLFVNT